MNLHQEITISRLKVHRRNMWFNPRTSKPVGFLRKDHKVKTIYDTGERLPGGIPVLSVKK